MTVRPEEPARNERASRRDQPEPEGRTVSPAWSRLVLAGAVALVLASLVSLVVLAVVVQRSDEPDVAAERDQVMSATTEFLVRLNTFGPDDLDASGRLPNYISGVTELMTAKFAAGFEESRQVPEALVAQAQYAREAEVNAVAVSTLGDDEATVLAAWEQIDSYPSPQNPEQRVEVLPRPQRWKVSLREVEGEWLVDDYEQFPAQAEGAPSTEPSVPPTAAPTGQPAPSSTKKPSGNRSGTGGGDR